MWRIIVDPIDGTRGLMYQKRSGWILTGVAPNHGPGTTLNDIEFAVQTEIPLVKQHLSDVLWAFRGEGANAERFNRLTGEHSSFQLQPSTANNIAQGYAQIVRFFPEFVTFWLRLTTRSLRERLVHRYPARRCASKTNTLLRVVNFTN